MRWIVLVMLPLALVTAGCTPAQQPPARAAAETFQTAVRASDADGACRLLSPETRGNLESASGKACAGALAGLDLPKGGVRSVEVWGDEALARLDGAVLFLARFRSGWRVTAAGCTPRAGKPYDCDVEG